MSVLADYMDHGYLPIMAVFVLRPCPNYKKPVLLRDTPTFFWAGQDGHPDMPFFKSSSLFEKTGGACMMDGDRWSVKQYKEKRDCQKAASCFMPSLPTIPSLCHPYPPSHRYGIGILYRYVRRKESVPSEYGRRH